MRSLRAFMSRLAKCVFTSTWTRHRRGSRVRVGETQKGDFNTAAHAYGGPQRRRPRDPPKPHVCQNPFADPRYPKHLTYDFAISPNASQCAKQPLLRARSPPIPYFSTVYAKRNCGAAHKKGIPRCQYSELETGIRSWVYLDRVTNNEQPVS